MLYPASVAKVLKPKKRCCKSRPRCKRCPVVCKRLVKAGLAKERPNGKVKLSKHVTKKALKSARA
jgi:hypothetical protein